jgi:hypothetical protein
VVGLAVLLLDLLDGETAGVVRRLRMVGHPEILEASLTCGLRHRLERLGPVGRFGVTVQNPVEVAVGDQFRQLALEGPFDLAAPLTQFRLDEWKPESVVDRRLLGRDEASPPCGFRQLPASCDRVRRELLAARHARPSPWREGGRSRSACGR